MEYPFEFFVGVYGLLASLAIMLGGAMPRSMTVLVPVGVIYAWAGTLGLGGATLLGGLARHHVFVVAMGLRLVTVALGTFMIAAVWLDPTWQIAPSILLLGFICALAGFRSFYLRTSALMARRIAKGK
jgi:hypothetical protein